MENTELMQKIRRCNRCGFCQQVCPTFQVTRLEGNVARGRVKLAGLIVEGQYDLAAAGDLIEYVNNCTLCGACVKNCPGGVETDKIILQLRANIAQKSGIPPVTRLIYSNLLLKKGFVKGIAKLARYYETSGVRRFVKRTGFLNAWPKVRKLEALLPPFHPGMKIGDAIRPVKNPRFKIAYFLGCGTEALFSQVAVDTVTVLQTMGCSVTIPDTTCCGEPQLSVGDLGKYRELAAKNLEVLLNGNYDYIVTDCATCGAALKGYAGNLKEDRELSERSARLVGKVQDLNEFIYRNLDLLEGKLNPLSGAVSYHDPCHLIRGQGITKEPREILKAIPGLSYCEMPKADQCCGGAGSYCVSHAHIAQKMLQSKIVSFQSTYSSVLATSCPGCMMHLGSGLRSLSIGAQVKHVVQVLAASLAGNQLKRGIH